jgi:hypothetical protein
MLLLISVQVPAEEEWAAMRELYKRSGVKFIVGAPLASSSTEVAEGMLKKSLELGPAVLGVEMGNEPNYWSCTGQVRPCMHDFLTSTWGAEGSLCGQDA